MKYLAVSILTAAALTAPPPAGSQADHDKRHAQGAGRVAHHEVGVKVVPEGGAMAEGEVRKVDKGAGKLTISHGPIPTMDMPMAMTMIYRVKEPAMLDRVKPGDKVKFNAKKIGGQYVVIRIEPAQ